MRNRGAPPADVQVRVLQLLHEILPEVCCIALPSREHLSWTITSPELAAEVLQVAGGITYIAVLKRTGELLENSEAKTLAEAFARIAGLIRTFSAAKHPVPVVQRRRAA